MARLVAVVSYASRGIACGKRFNWPVAWLQLAALFDWAWPQQ